jgi:hypothetical protein
MSFLEEHGMRLLAAVGTANFQCDTLTTATLMSSATCRNYAVSLSPARPDPDRPAGG